MEGSDLSSEMSKVWRNIAASENRLILMKELLELGVGFGEIEQFNLDLESKFRSEEFKERSNEHEIPCKVIKEAMEIKLRDERKYNQEQNREKIRLRQELEKIYKKNSKPYRGKIKKV
jgi:hypothetical protein